MNLQELKDELDQAEVEVDRLKELIKERKQQIANLSCPWKIDDIIRDTGDGKLYIVDEIEYSDYLESGWKVLCTKIKKDFTFGMYRETIQGGHAEYYRVTTDFVIVETGILPKHKAAAMRMTPLQHNPKRKP